MELFFGLFSKYPTVEAIGAQLGIVVLYGLSLFGCTQADGEASLPYAKYQPAIQTAPSIAPKPSISAG